jgi:hypothetical protein
MVITDVTYSQISPDNAVRLGWGGGGRGLLCRGVCGILIYATELETDKDNEDPWVRAIKDLCSSGLRDLGQQDVQRNYMTMTDVLQVHGF